MREYGNGLDVISSPHEANLFPEYVIEEMAMYFLQRIMNDSSETAVEHDESL